MTSSYGISIEGEVGVIVSDRIEKRFNVFFWQAALGVAFAKVFNSLLLLLNFKSDLSSALACRYVEVMHSMSNWASRILVNMGVEPSGLISLVAVIIRGSLSKSSVSFSRRTETKRVSVGQRPSTLYKKKQAFCSYQNRRF